MSELRIRIAERAYFMSLAGIGADDLDRWLTAEGRETQRCVEASPPERSVVKPRRRPKAAS